MAASPEEWLLWGMGPAAWTTLTLLGTVVGLFVLERWWHMRTLERLGYTGPPKNFFTGHFKIFADMNAEFPDGWTRLIETYGSQIGNLKGKSLALYLGRRPCIVVTNPEVIKHIGIRDFDNFRNRPGSKMQRNKNLLSLRDDRWRKVRHVLTPAFSQAKMKLMSQAINNSITVTLEIIDEHVKENKPIDFYSVYHGLTLDVINKCALAIEVDSQRDKENPLLQNVKELMKGFKINSFAIFFASTFPSLAMFIRKTFGVKFSTKRQLTLLKYVKQVIKERRASSKERKTVDALQLMLEAAQLVGAGKDEEIPSSNGSAMNGHPVTESGAKVSKHQENGSSKQMEDSLPANKERQQLMSEEEVADNALVFLLAGYETTSTMLSFASYALAKHPDIQRRLQEEIDEHVGDGGEVTHDMINHMQYLDMVLHEALRFYPPIPGTVSREVINDYEYEGLKFPEESVVHFPISFMHFNEEIWPDPRNFDPERFHPDRKKDIHVAAFLPFGLGPRNCIGMRFAMMEAKLAMARILRRYHLETCPLTETDLKTKAANISLTPASGHIYLACTPR